MATPSLAMIPSGYKASKVYSVLPESGVGDFDFTRATTATRVNSSGLIEEMAINVPRLEYPLIDGVVNGCPSLKLEPQSTNLVEYSEDFSQWSVFTYGGASLNLTSGYLAPDGSANAYEFDFTQSSGGSLITLDTTTTASADHSLSIWLKGKVGGEKVRIDFRNGGSSGVSGELFTLTTDWVRYDVTVTNDTGTSRGFQIRLTNSDSIGTETFYVWGAQLEELSYATSYIPTSGSAVTRNAETCNGAGNAATFNDSEGVLMAEISALANDLTTRYIAIDSSNSNNYILLRYDTVSNNIAVVYKAYGLSGVTLTHIVSDVTTFNKVLFKYKDADFSLWINGLEVSTSNATNRISSGNVFNNLTFSVSWNANAKFYGNTKQLQYYNTVLTDSELEKLTSWTSFTDMANGQQYSII